MLIACLDFRNTSSEPFQYEGFSKIAHELGHDVESLSHSVSAKSSLLTAYSRACELVNKTTAFFLPNSNAIYGFSLEGWADESQPTLANLIRTRIRGGARVLVQPCVSGPEFDAWNSFLAPYDMTVNTLQICRRKGNSINCSPGLKTAIHRSAHSFRESSLFQGVEQVVLDQPFAIWYGGESLPVLCATDQELPIDWKTDRLPIPESRWTEGSPLPSEWNARELACMAVWHGDNCGAVLTSKGSALYDPLIQENARLAKNIIRWLCGAERPLTPEERCHRIEINLVDFVLGVVKITEQNWWTNRIPLPIRQKCAERHEEEKCRWPKEAYFDLIDLKTIMSKEWGLFEPHLRAVGCAGGKEKSLAWLDRLNEIRRLIGHPLKKHVAGYTFAEEEESFLKDCDELVRKLFRRIKSET